MVTQTLLDTDMLSEILKGRNPAVVERAKAYRAHYGRFTTSALVATEIIKGYHRIGRNDRITELFAILITEDVLPFDLETAETAGRIIADLDRTGQPIGHIDPLIAATAVRHDLTLATGNIRHFKRVQQLGYPLKLEDWRRPVRDENDKS